MHRQYIIQNSKYIDTDACGNNSKTAVALKKQFFFGNYRENSMACVQVDFVSKKIQFLYYAKIKNNAVLRFRQLVPFCFLFVPWSQSAPTSAKKGSYKKVITASIKIGPHRTIRRKTSIWYPTGID
jgi:hypothetical protein